MEPLLVREMVKRLPGLQPPETPVFTVALAVSFHDCTGCGIPGLEIKTKDVFWCGFLEETVLIFSFVRLINIDGNVLFALSWCSKCFSR